METPQALWKEAKFINNEPKPFKPMIDKIMKL